MDSQSQTVARSPSVQSCPYKSTQKWFNSIHALRVRVISTIWHDSVNAALLLRVKKFWGLPMLQICQFYAPHLSVLSNFYSFIFERAVRFVPQVQTHHG
eukprot:2182530-Amphidinium_carterae.1